MEQTYTNQEIVAKITEIVHASELISPKIVTYAQSLGERDELSRLLIVVYDAFRTEQQIGSAGLELVGDALVTFNQQRVQVYIRAQKKVIKIAEQQDIMEQEVFHFDY